MYYTILKFVGVSMFFVSTNGGVSDEMARELKLPINIRVDEELDAMITALAVRRGETKAEVCRRLLRRAAEEEYAEDSLDPVLIAVRKAMADTLKPVEERLAKINAKSAIAAATAMYMALQVYHEMGKDGRALYEEAWKRAVAFVKMPHDELAGVKE